jgi:hypothetical protein
MTVYGTMWDSASGAYPPGAALCAYYLNGLWARKPVEYGRGKVWIDVLGTAPTEALWLDVETGDATPADVPGWLDERADAKLDAGGVYCSISNLEAVETAAASRPHLLWVATLDGNTAPSLPRVSGQLVAVQAIPASMLGFDADMSVVTDPGWWSSRALG